VVAERDARPTQVAYDTLEAERDARFVDTDEDGLTDVKEAELETDSSVETVFYLQGDYETAVATAGSQGRQAGRADVTETPGNFNLTTVEAYNTVIAERDARPTLGEVKDARLGSVVLQPYSGDSSVRIRFSIEETDDLKVWTKRDEVNEVIVPLELDKKFYRFALQDE
jgi:hypothetical protein